MLTRRIIPCLDVAGGRVVKGVNFVALVDAGDPVAAARAYDLAGADELCFLDITASHENRDTLLDVVRRTADEIFLPLTVGGGVRSVEDVRKLLLAGADKVAINSAALARPELVREAADRFGSQAIVIAIDARRRPRPGTAGGAAGDRDGDPHGDPRVAHWEVYTHGGRRATGKDAVAWAQEVAESGAGEILLTSMDRDGTRQGYDVVLTRAVAEAVSVPVIASGGVGNLQHLYEGLADGRADAVLAASIFHFGEYSIAQAKRYLLERGIPIRPVADEGDEAARLAVAPLRRAVQVPASLALATAPAANDAEPLYVEEEPTRRTFPVQFAAEPADAAAPPPGSAPKHAAPTAPSTAPAPAPVAGTPDGTVIPALIPAIVQDARDGRVLMLAYMDDEARRLTESTGEVHFYSRSRRRLWRKGETSGHVLRLVSLTADCDGDTLLVRAVPVGPTCHTGSRTCFGTNGVEPPPTIFDALQQTIAARRALPPGTRSYVRALLDGGWPAILAKVDEEASELGAELRGDGSTERVVAEAADLLFHLLVALGARDVPLAAVQAELARREGVSGLDEKAARKK